MTQRNPAVSHVLTCVSATSIRSSYLVTKNANFVACHNQSYMEKYDIVSEIKPGGTFLLNCTWTPEELDHHLSAEVKRTIANKQHPLLHH